MDASVLSIKSHEILVKESFVENERREEVGKDKMIMVSDMTGRKMSDDMIEIKVEKMINDENDMEKGRRERGREREEEQEQEEMEKKNDDDEKRVSSDDMEKDRRGRGRDRDEEEEQEEMEKKKDNDEKRMSSVSCMSEDQV